MTTNEKISISIQSLFNFADIMYRLFVSVYIYIYTDSLVTTSIYTLIRMTFILLFMINSAYINRNHKLSFIYITSFILQTISLAWALYATDLFAINIAFVYISAILMGSGEGLYYFATNTSMQIVTTNNSRTKYFSILGLLKTITALLAPFVANRLIISSTSDLIAYRKILVLLIILYIAISIITLKFNVKAEITEVNLKDNLDWNNRKWRDVLVATFYSTIRESLNWAWLAILVSNYSSNGKTYSAFQTVFQLFGLVLYFFLSKFMSKKYYRYSFFIGAFMYSFCTIVLVLTENLMGAIIYGFMNTLNDVLFNTAFNLSVSKVLEEYKDNINNRIIIREFAYYLGRIPAILFVVLCYYLFPSYIYYKIPLVIYAIFPFITYKIMVKHYQ